MFTDNSLESDSCFVLILLCVQDVRREERVELRVEVWVFEVVVADEGEDAAQGEDGDDAAHVVRVHQEVGQEEGAGQVGHHLEETRMSLHINVKTISLRSSFFIIFLF